MRNEAAGVISHREGTSATFLRDNARPIIHRGCARARELHATANIFITVCQGFRVAGRRRFIYSVKLAPRRRQRIAGETATGDTLDCLDRLIVASAIFFACCARE